MLSGKVAPSQLITHHFALGDIMAAYETFSHAQRERALKVIIANDETANSQNLTTQEDDARSGANLAQ